MAPEEKQHLCTRCKDKRDWENDPYVKSLMAIERGKPEKDRHRCGYCGEPLANIFFKLHTTCAKQEGQCQCCTKTMRVEGAADPGDWEEVVDFFTLLVKSYGITPARRLVMASSIWETQLEVVSKLINLTLHNLDEESRLDRPVWKKVLAGRIMRNRYCQNCPPPSANYPAIGHAEKCGHLVVGEKAEWCALCAADQFVCEICGNSVK